MMKVQKASSGYGKQPCREMSLMTVARQPLQRFNEHLGGQIFGFGGAAGAAVQVAVDGANVQALKRRKRPPVAPGSVNRPGFGVRRQRPGRRFSHGPFRHRDSHKLQRSDKGVIFLLSAWLYSIYHRNPENGTHTVRSQLK